MPRPEVETIIGDLRRINATTEDILDVVKGLGVDDATVVALLQTLTADVTWDTSVTFHKVEDVLAAVQAVAAAEADEEAALAAFQADVDGRLDALAATLAQILALIQPPPPSTATSVTLTIQPSGGTKSMGTTITVDTANEIAVLAFVDDFNNVTSAPTAADGSAAVLNTTSDTPTVVAAAPFTLAADGTYTAPVTPLGVPGGVSIGASVQDSTGADIPLPAPAADGSTTFSAEAGTVALTVTPGAPVGDRLSLA